jgi:prepilin-type N-terminal cleavage/methylation domain-containing protein
VGWQVEEMMKKQINAYNSYRYEHQKGFTLVEVVAVLLILGILAAAALPKFTGMQETAREKALKGAIDELNAQVVMAFSNNRLQNGNPGEYSGYTGQIGTDFIVSGQAPDTPSVGTIKLAGQAGTYRLNWSDGSLVEPGYFTLGPEV